MIVWIGWDRMIEEEAVCVQRKKLDLVGGCEETAAAAGDLSPKDSTPYYTYYCTCYKMHCYPFAYVLGGMMRVQSV